MSQGDECSAHKRQRTDSAHNPTLREQIAEYSIIVADTGDIKNIEKFKPTDATTNPSLILKACDLVEYAPLIDAAIQYAKDKKHVSNEIERLEIAMDKVAVNIGAKISANIPGYISTEVDARLSFDTKETVRRAVQIIDMYRELGIDKSRILIKIASTFEGIEAGKILQRDHGINCNLTLLFSLVQAAACAESNIRLISPFVGRILDWYKAKTGKAYDDAEEDPGVISVKTIYNYYKKFGYETIVMAASFRNINEIKALAGCDRLTISPALLEEMEQAASGAVVGCKLEPRSASDACSYHTRIATDESNFRLQLNEDAMATEKLAEGIRGFVADIRKLEDIIKTKLC